MKVQKLLEAINQWHPKIGWWLDNDPITFYHGTHTSRLEAITKNGIVAPKEGPTAGWVSLALEPNTALGYASMHGGEASFRQAGGKAKHVPIDERICLVIQIPQSYLKSKMKIAGNLDKERERMTDPNAYKAWVEEKSAKFNGEYKDIFDQEYYAACEIRLPKIVPAQFIKSSMKK